MALFGSGSATAIWNRPLYWPQFGPRPFWVSHWFWTPAFTTQWGAVEIGPAALNSSAPRVGFRNSSAAATWGPADTNDAGGSQSVTISYTGTASKWTHSFYALRATNDREYYFEGISRGSLGNNLTGPQTLTSLKVGFAVGGTLGTTQMVAEVCVGTGILSLPQIAALAGGVNPLAIVPNGQIVCYYPLRGDLVDHGPQEIGLTPTATGSTPKFGEHPLVALPPQRHLFRKLVSARRRTLMMVA